MTYEVHFPDGEVRKVGVSRISDSSPAVVDGYWGEGQFGQIRWRKRGYLVRRERRYGDLWGPWSVTGEGWDRPDRRHRPRFSPETIAEAVEITRGAVERATRDMKYPATDHSIARIFDGHTMGWDDAKTWNYTTDEEPDGLFKTPVGPGRWQVVGFIEDAVALARKARSMLDSEQREAKA